MGAIVIVIVDIYNMWDLVEDGGIGCENEMVGGSLNLGLGSVVR
jgi:hypothetical protein